MHYIYVLHQKRRATEFYIGYTEDLRRRLKQHQRNFPSELLYYEAYKSKQAAREREKKLKFYGSVWRTLKKRISA
ncbi:GIY-YIG nuclease family protein [Patescibacteria group bacterium]|nr:GIY-YIG nuclease family protein [Patescibacteria group bacterium]